MNPLLARYFLYYPVKYVRGENLPYDIHEYKITQRWKREDYQRYQLQQLKKIIAYALKYVPYYQKVFAEHQITADSIQSLEDLSKIPMTTRDIMNKHRDEFYSKQKFLFLTRKITSGSTSEPLLILKNADASAREDAALWRFLSWWGINPGDRQARFWGIPLDESKKKQFPLADFIMNRIRIPATTFKHEDLLDYYSKIKKFHPKYFYGYPSIIMEFTRAILKEKMSPKEFKLKAIVVTAEPILPEEKTFLEKKYGCPVVIDYGTSEFGPIAYSCPRGALHIASENLIVEIVKKDGRPAATNEEGEIVVTDLHNLAMPFIRYKTGDFGKLSDEYCQCGFEQPILKNLIGRGVSLLTARDGRYVHATIPYYLAQKIAKETGRGFQFQLIQTKPDLIIVNVKKNDYNLQKNIHIFIQQLKQYFGKDMKFKYNCLDEIPREKSGKFVLTKNLTIH